MKCQQPLILDELLEGKVDDEHDELNDAETDALPSGQETVMKQEEDSVKALKNQSFFSDLQKADYRKYKFPPLHFQNQFLLDQVAMQTNHQQLI